MKTSDFDYFLPENLIAQAPAMPRDSSRLLVYNRKEDEIKDRVFSDIVDYLEEGDTLVINDTKVLPARLFGKKSGTDRDVEFLLLKRIDLVHWEVILKPGKKLKIGDYVDFDGLSAKILEKKQDGVTLVALEFQGVLEEILERIGSMPLPPYITQKLEEKERYQTVYAREPGSAAAPTAGLHFTPELLKKIEAKGINIVKVLLHVGLGTFRPVKAEDILDHVMHSESYSVSAESAQLINETKAAGKRVIAVGTTSVRTLESACDEQGIIKQGSGDTSIFIFPGYKFKVVDTLITNFHLPKSTLLMLISAFMGKENALKMYRYAVENEYRFFSFGDATLII